MAKWCPLMSELDRRQNRKDLDGLWGFEGKVGITPRFLLWLVRARMRCMEGCQGLMGKAK